jgi:hypothetical protein
MGLKNPEILEPAFGLVKTYIPLQNISLELLLQPLMEPFEHRQLALSLDLNTPVRKVPDPPLQINISGKRPDRKTKTYALDASAVINMDLLEFAHIT